MHSSQSRGAAKTFAWNSGGPMPVASVRPRANAESVEVGSDLREKQPINFIPLSITHEFREAERCECAQNFYALLGFGHVVAQPFAGSAQDPQDSFVLWPKNGLEIAPNARGHR